MSGPDLLDRLRAFSELRRLGVPEEHAEAALDAAELYAVAEIPGKELIVFCPAPGVFTIRKAS